VNITRQGSLVAVPSRWMNQGGHHEVFARLEIGVLASSRTVLEVEGALEDVADSDIAVVVMPTRRQVRAISAQPNQ
jgi:hypothetical protein